MGIIKKNRIFWIGLSLIIIGAFLFYFYTFNPSINTQNFLSCPSKTILGLNCPGCGAQRMIHHLLHFELGLAFRYNPLLFLMLPFIGFLVLQSLSNLFLGTKYRTKFFYDNRFVWLVFGMLILYAVLRNLPFFPFDYLAPPK